MTNHRPNRPCWTCTACGNPWPSPPARTEILDRHPGNRGHLATHLTRLTATAAADLRMPTPTLLYRRFVTWALDPGHDCRVCGRAGHDVYPGLPPRLVPCGRVYNVAKPKPKANPNHAP